MNQTLGGSSVYLAGAAWRMKMVCSLSLYQSQLQSIIIVCSQQDHPRHLSTSGVKHLDFVIYIYIYIYISDYNMPYSLKNALTRFYYFNIFGGVKLAYVVSTNHVFTCPASPWMRLRPPPEVVWVIGFISVLNAFRRAFTPGLFRIG